MINILTNPFNLAVASIVGIAYVAAEIAVMFSPEYDSIEALIKALVGFI
jgi:hypothetical protein